MSAGAAVHRVPFCVVAAAMVKVCGSPTLLVSEAGVTVARMSTQVLVAWTSTVLYVNGPPDEPPGGVKPGMLTTALVAVSVAVPMTAESKVTRHWPETSVVHEYEVGDSWVAPLTRVAEAGETAKMMFLPEVSFTQPLPSLRCSCRVNWWGWLTALVSLAGLAWTRQSIQVLPAEVVEPAMGAFATGVPPTGLPVIEVTVSVPVPGFVVEFTVTVQTPAALVVHEVAPADGDVTWLPAGPVHVKFTVTAPGSEVVVPSKRSTSMVKVCDLPRGLVADGVTLTR